MYEERPDSSIFRQGDVLPAIQFVRSEFCGIASEAFTVPQQRIESAPIALVSQCCELQWYQNDRGYPVPRRPQILVAPLRGVPFREGSSEYKALQTNGASDEANDPVQYFYYPAIKGALEESVADLGAIFPIRTADLKNKVGPKLLQLNVQTRHLFRQRLIDYFARVPEEDEAELEKLSG